MRVRHVKIENFRGIQSLEWVVPDGLTCLIGPGDATKTTVIDAIELALFPRWSVLLDDGDFYQADTTTPFVIDVTVGDLPERLKDAHRFGLDLRGWDAEKETVDEVGEGSESVLTIRFTADDSLEPRWLVVSGREPEGRPIGHRDRELLGATRFGAGTDRQFTWGTGTLLARLTEKPDVAHELAAAARQARAGSDLSGVDTLSQVVTKVANIARAVGLTLESPSASLDPAAVSLRSGAIALHQGGVPFRRAGLGSRMLVLLAMQRELGKGGGLGLVDEVEQGLEPHRLRGVLRALKEDGGQVIATSHSPIAIHELGPANVAVVRSVKGVTTIRSIPSKLRRFILKTPEVLLARKVLVCEGRTELGLCRFLDEHWDGRGTTLAAGGAALCDGCGSEASLIASNLKDLGYDVFLLGDSDCPTSPSDEVLQRKGVIVSRWPEERAFETQLVHDLPWSGLLDLAQFAADEHGEERIRSMLESKLGPEYPNATWPPSSWDARDINVFKDALSLAALTKVNSKLDGWFKRVDLAYGAARVAFKHVTDPECPLLVTASTIRKWVDAL